MSIVDRRLRRRFWVEVAVTAFFAIVTTLTLAVPDWIEALSGFDPDSGDGSAEWAIVALIGCATLAIAWLAAREWQHEPIASATA